MFASQWGKKAFIKIMLFSWTGILFPWFSFDPKETGYWWGFYGLQYIMIQMILLGVFCNVIPKKESFKSLLPILIEICLITIPLCLIWQLMTWHTLYVTGEISLSIGLRTAYPSFWIALALTLIPIVAYPILKRWSRDETQ
ncbi:hypothetical protein [Anaerotignum sp.]|uniref:hypothetical protein n=1 Tax=Anaerotignum sp. TaxID=2039241 RepID=UPI0028B21BC7|nr:hypothetical protein [Anaerotignum sp.]